MSPTNRNDEASQDIQAFRWTLDRIHWYVVAAALAFGLTISFIKVTPSFVGLASLFVAFGILMRIVSIRRKNDLYSAFGTIVAIVGMLSLRSFFGMPATSGAIAALGTGLLIPFALLWLCRSWVKRFCRLDESAIQPRNNLC